MFDESFAEAWKLRYGVDPAVEIPELTPFLRHRSIRHYADREIPESTVSALVAAAQSASTSSNLQLWSLVSVEDPAKREQIATMCDNQRHVREAPWFFAFLADHHRIRQAAHRVGEAADGLGLTEFFAMALIDASIACERMVAAAESLGMGTCYIGSLRNDPQGVADVLKLPVGVFGAFGLCLGYPADQPVAEIKPRLGQSQVWFRDAYDPTADVTDYDARMSAFYEAQKMKGEVTWSMRSGRRIGRNKLSGREVLLAWLRDHGIATG